MLRKSTAWSSNNKGLTKTDMSVIVLTSAPLCTPTCARWSQTCINHMHIGKKNKKKQHALKNKHSHGLQMGFPVSYAHTDYAEHIDICKHRHMKTWNLYTHTHSQSMASLALTLLLLETRALRAISFTCKLTPTSPHTHAHTLAWRVCVCVCVLMCEPCSCSAGTQQRCYSALLLYPLTETRHKEIERQKER